MKRKIVGLSGEVFGWIDKKTGSQKYGFNLFVEGTAKNVTGIKVWNLFIDNGFDIFDVIASIIDTGKGDSLVGAYCDVSYNENGYLEELVLLDTSVVASKK